MKAEDLSRSITQATSCTGRLFAGDLDPPIVASATDSSAEFTE